MAIIPDADQAAMADRAARIGEGVITRDAAMAALEQDTQGARERTAFGQGGGLDPREFPQSAAVGADIQAVARGVVDYRTDVESRRLARVAIMRAISYVPKRDGRGSTRHDSLAITALEDALLRLTADDIL